MAESIMELILKRLEENIGDALAHLGLGNKRNVKLLKRTRDLKNGDVIVPLGCIDIDELKTVELLNYLKSITSARKDYIMKVTRNTFSITAFHLDRAQFCKAVFKEIQDKDDRYGHANVRVDNSVFVNCINTVDINNQTSLSDLRISVLGCHVENLLEANGYSVISQEGNRNNLHNLIDSSKSGDTERGSQQPIRPDQSKMEQLFIKKVRQQHKHGKCDYRVQMVDTQSVDGDCHDDRAVEEDVLDLKKIIQDKDLCTGNGGFDLNLDKVMVVKDGKPTEVMQDAISLAELLQSKQCRHCLSLVYHQQVFRQQQIQLILAALSSAKIQQSLQVVGPVIAKQGESTSSRNTAQELYKNRYLQMKEASEIRSTDQSSDRKVQLLTSASIKLDLLANTSHTPLHVDTSSADRGAESRLGAFVLYNTARLATLMSHFNQGVRQGLYQSLPPVEDVDYSLLREEEDWELVFLYMAAFPEVVRQSVEVVFPMDGKCFAKIHTHKVTSFIVAFTKCLSAHYSRYHVLTGGQAHLLPLMYARLYVLKSAHQVLINSLQLVGVEALSFL